MSYRIEYDGAVGKYEVRSVHRGFPSWLMGIGAVLLIGVLMQRGRWVDFLIPGDDAVTVQAFHAMTNDLRSGANLQAAFYDFCKLVIRGG